ncbi:MAG: hypothetical protein HY901_14760 [Deltaproteobacteria bacterium]|nr:hypothetical protein [Deltaproteobacteria bacterium]
MPTSSARLQRPPNPKPLIVAVMTVAFFGGSCTVQEMLGSERELPSQQEVAKLLGEPASQETEAGTRLVAASMAMIQEQTRVTKRFQPFTTVLGFVLVSLYSFAFVLGLRAFAFAPGAAKPLSTVAVLVLPARVAFAAVDLATAQALEPAIRAMAAAYAEANSGQVPAEEAAKVATLVTEGAPWLMVLAQVGSALLVCVLFHYAWRYFQRPEVLAFFERQSGGAATGG